MRRIEVGRADDPALATLLEPYRDQKDAWLRAQRQGGTGLCDGLFIAEGELVVGMLIQSRDHQTVSVLCTPRRYQTMLPLLERLPPGTPVLVAERPILEDLIGFDLHRGVLAVGTRQATPSAAEVAAAAKAGSGVLVVCEELANHDNIGAIFRNTSCLAGARSGVLLSPGSCDPLYRKSLRVSMGHALRVPFATLSPWPAGLAGLAAAGFDLLAMTPDGKVPAITRPNHVPNRGLAILLGAEGPGLTEGALAAVDAAGGRRIRIPMAPGADSLNVATALAVALSWMVAGTV
ncbi:MAG: RNA methyltransferase [Phycisphaerales bacterium]|nr:RNA methyltransferase [Phycisphaerales bacterium]